MTPRASFVIPAFNAERYISKALHSCRNQTVKQIEIIVVNDGSTDATADIVDWHASKDARIRVLNQENKGRSAARNLGNDQAQSNLILVLDADDMATRNRVKDTLTVFELKKPDLLYGSFFRIDSIGTVLEKVRCPQFDPTVSKKKRLNFICHSTMAYTKRLAMDVRYESGDYARLGMDDWKFQWEANRKGYTFLNIKNPLCYYRMTEQGISQIRDNDEVNKVKDAYLSTVA